MPRMDKPLNRPLKVYAFDPSKGRNLNNYMTIQVHNEDLTPGPAGGYVAVIDYDAANDCYYEPVNLNDPDVLLRGGLDPSESDPRFHQQMVYTVVSETIRRFEFALGRKIKWRRPRGNAQGDPFRDKLRIFPHGLQEANAFYDPGLRALVFGYFPAGSSDVGANLPGQTVFTCLSHDIVVHETTHALIDGLREKFTEATHADTPAFHEAFADIVALFQHFSYKEALLDTIYRTGGMLHRTVVSPDARPGRGGASVQGELTQSNPLVELAKQFGEAMGMRSALRSALGTPPDSKALETTFEPHARGAILVSAVFDAFFSIYLKRTRDLMRIARAEGRHADSDLHPDLANRLAAEAAKVAGHFVNLSVRALDYCPPVDIRYGEFLRALITADSDLVMDDSWGYRTALIEAFRSRGIVPEDVVSYSEEALRWNPPDRPLSPCTGLDFDILGRGGSRAARWNATLLNRFAKTNAAALRLDPRLKVQTFSFHPNHRVSPRGRLVFDYVVEFLQQKEALVNPKDPASQKFVFRGGTTVVFDQDGQVRYTVAKRVDNRWRLDQQRAFHQRAGYMSAMAPYLTKPGTLGMNFSSIHRGY